MSEVSTDFENLVGSVLAERYRVNALLGVGGMGAVFDAEHLLMRKRVAIKLLLPDVSQSGEIVARFEREAMAAANIDHPNVVAATDFGKLPDGSFYLVLEFVEGRNLRQLLAYGALPPNRALHIVEQIASALTKAHALGIVHRDLKPENVMLVRKDGDPDFVKVLDFGIAKVPVESLSGQQVQTGQGLTRLGVMYGTPEYMAPEQAMGTGVDHRADLYALGVMLFEMVTGDRPFDAENVVSLVTMHIVDPPPPLAERCPPGTALPEGLEDLTARLLEKERTQRIQSAQELIERIRGILGVSPAPSPAAFLAAQSVASAPTVAQPAQLLASSQDLPAGYAPPSSEEPRWRQEWGRIVRDTDRFRSQLPGPLAKLPLAVFPAMLGIVFFLIVGVVAWPRNTSGGANQPAASASASTIVVGLTQEELESAKATGSKALEALSERFPEDPRVRHALLAAYHHEKRPLEAVKVLSELAKSEKVSLSEDQTLAVIKAALEGPADASDAAFTLLETGLGEDGIEFLYSLWTTKKDVNEKVRQRAGKSLAKLEVKERAAKATRVLIDLKVMPASCETRRAAVVLARESGDARAVPLMRALQSKRGCGFAGFQDCWSCLRRDNVLGEAIKAAEKRPAP